MYIELKLLNLKLIENPLFWIYILWIKKIRKETRAKQKRKNNSDYGITGTCLLC